MFDWPKQRKIQKFVSAANPCALKETNPAIKTGQSFFITLFGCESDPVLSLRGRGLCRLANDGMEGRLGRVVTIEQQRAALRAPRDSVVYAPKCNDLHVFAVFKKRAKESSVGIGKALVGIADEAALGRGGVIGHVRANVALPTLCAV